MNLDALYIKTEVIHAVREFFDTQHFKEVFTPVMLRGLPLELSIFAFETHWQTHRHDTPLYLSIYPETSMKKLLAAGVNNCYTIGKCFRNLEGSGHHHNPEFLMLEWYRIDEDYTQIMSDTQALFLAVKHHVDHYLNRPVTNTLEYNGQKILLSDKWPKLSLDELFKKYVGVSIAELLDDTQIHSVAQTKGYSTQAASWGELFDQLFLNEIEPNLPQTAFFLIDFPARLSPLCRPRADKPYLAQRFETYIGGMEVGNGNTENLDVDLIQTSFADATMHHQTTGRSMPPIDTEFLTALTTLANKHTSLAGNGVGVDRLAMLMANATHISEVEPFALTESLVSTKK